MKNIWYKSVVLGSLWAAMEIILGNFLHSLRLPFAGMILSGFAVALITATQQKWHLRGLIFRAGIVCAAMKLLSPGVNIFGPIIAILIESLIFELIIFIGGANNISFLIGGGLAVTWSLSHKIISYLISYGFDIVLLYNNIVDFISTEVKIQGLTPGYVLIVFYLIYFIFGVAFSLMGILIGKRSSNNNELQISGSKEILFENTTTPDITYSTIRLVTHILFIIVFLLALKNIPLWFAAIFLAAYLYTVIRKYKNTLRHLKKLNFWLSFIIITLLASYFIGGIQSKQWGFNAKGLQIGIEMNLRAILLVFAFSAISIELKLLPLIKNIKSKKSGQFIIAIDLAFSILPFIIEKTSINKSSFKNPLKFLSNQIGYIDTLTQIVENKFSEHKNNKIIFITGSQGIGKTTYLKKIANFLKEKNEKVIGFISEAVYKEKDRIGYDAKNLSSNERVILCRKKEMLTSENSVYNIGNFSFLKAGFDFGENIFNANNFNDFKYIIVDELGLLEAEKIGWYNLVNNILGISSGKTMIFSVRKSSLKVIKKLFNFNSVYVYDLDTENINNIIEL